MQKGEQRSVAVRPVREKKPILIWLLFLMIYETQIMTTKWVRRLVLMKKWLATRRMFCTFLHFSTVNQLSGTDFSSSLICSALAGRKKGAKSKGILNVKIHFWDVKVVSQPQVNHRLHWTRKWPTNHNTFQHGELPISQKSDFHWDRLWSIFPYPHLYRIQAY